MGCIRVPCTNRAPDTMRSPLDTVGTLVMARTDGTTERPLLGPSMHRCIPCRRSRAQPAPSLGTGLYTGREGVASANSSAGVVSYSRCLWAVGVYREWRRSAALLHGSEGEIWCRVHCLGLNALPPPPHPQTLLPAHRPGDVSANLLGWSMCTRQSQSQKTHSRKLSFCFTGCFAGNFPLFFRAQKWNI